MLSYDFDCRVFFSEFNAFTMDFVEIIAIGHNKKVEHLRLLTCIPTDYFIIIEVLVQDNLIAEFVLRPIVYR